MAIEQFIERKFQGKTLELIAKAQGITEDYKRRGFTLTLRQLYYQFVARGHLENTFQNYKRLGSIIDDARQAGLLDWSTIEDRTRNVEFPSVWASATAILKAVADQYKENPWLQQEYRPEVWIEKDALVGVIEGVCDEFRVPYFACRGYASQSEIYDAGKRFRRLRQEGFKPIVFYLGDHDPSGIHMPNDLASRLEMFSRGFVEIRRLALNRDQIDQYDPPPNPAKETDSRFESYAAEHGDESWELDALDPDVIANLIRDELEGIKDQDEWDQSMAREENERHALDETHDNWSQVKRYLKHRHHDIGAEYEMYATPDDILSDMDSRATEDDTDD